MVNNQLRPMRLDTRHMDAFQKIQSYYQEKKGKIVLSSTVEQMRKRMLILHTAMSEWEHKTDLADKYSKKWKVSAATVYNYCKLAERLFTLVLETDPESKRAYLDKAYTAGMKAALEDKDWANVSFFGLRLEKLHGLQDPKTDTIDWSKVYLLPIEITSDVKTLEGQARDLMNEYAEDAEWSEA